MPICRGLRFFLQLSLDEVFNVLFQIQATSGHSCKTAIRKIKIQFAASAEDSLQRPSPWWREGGKPISSGNQSPSHTGSTLLLHPPPWVCLSGRAKREIPDLALIHLREGHNTPPSPGSLAPSACTPSTLSLC